MTLPVRHRPGTPPRRAPYRALPVPGGTADRAENVSASLADGLLTVTAPRTQAAKPRHSEVTTALPRGRGGQAAPLRADWPGVCGGHSYRGACRDPVGGDAHTLPTAAGAAKAVRNVSPLQDDVDGIALRAPVPVGVGSIAASPFLTGQEAPGVRRNEVFHQDAASDRHHSVLVVVGSPPERNGIVADLRASIVNLTLTTINVANGLLKVMADYDDEWAGAEQTGRQAAGRVTTTAGPLR